MIANNNRTRGRTLAGLMLQGLVRRNLTEDLNLCAPNATITMMVSVLQNATSATELAIWPGWPSGLGECPQRSMNLLSIGGNSRWRNGSTLNRCSRASCVPSLCGMPEDNADGQTHHSHGELRGGGGDAGGRQVLCGRGARCEEGIVGERRGPSGELRVCVDDNWIRAGLVVETADCGGGWTGVERGAGRAGGAWGWVIYGVVVGPLAKVVGVGGVWGGYGEYGVDWGGDCCDGWGWGVVGMGASVFSMFVCVGELEVWGWRGRGVFLGLRAVRLRARRGVCWWLTVREGGQCYSWLRGLSVRWRGGCQTWGKELWWRAVWSTEVRGRGDGVRFRGTGELRRVGGRGILRWGGRSKLQIPKRWG
ncbi:hypothetical protein Tco_1576779 [Tanacetum coccineum]